jgi:hypothetical protein
MTYWLATSGRWAVSLSDVSDGTKCRRLLPPSISCGHGAGAPFLLAARSDSRWTERPISRQLDPSLMSATFDCQCGYTVPNWQLVFCHINQLTLYEYWHLNRIITRLFIHNYTAVNNMQMRCKFSTKNMGIYLTRFRTEWVIEMRCRVERGSFVFGWKNISVFCLKKTTERVDFET